MVLVEPRDPHVAISADLLTRSVCKRKTVNNLTRKIEVFKKKTYGKRVKKGEATKNMR
jgi:hypothetical protein